MLAKLYMARNEPAKALKEADGVISLDKNNLQAHLTRSAALPGIGDKEKARIELDLITKAYPTNAEARYQVGFLAYQDKDYKKAEQVFGEMYKRNPNDTRGLAGITESLAAENRMGDAIKETQEAIAKEPQRRDLKLVLAKFYVRSERYDEAIAIYQLLVSQDPRSPRVADPAGGDAADAEGDLNAAVETFRRRLQPSGSVRLRSCLTQLGLIHRGHGQKNGTMPSRSTSRILKIEPSTRPVALNNLAFIKAEEGVDLDQALSMSQRARQANWPNSPEVSDTLGWIYIKKNLSEDAVRVFKDLTAQVPNRATFHYHYGMALLQKGDKPAARREFEAALADNPSVGDARRRSKICWQKL